MTEIVDLAVYTHRWSDYLPECLESIAKTTRGNYNIIIVDQPGSVHENMLRAWNRGSERFFCFIDEDVQFLAPGWLDALLEDFEKDDELGALGVGQFKEEAYAFDYQMAFPEGKYVYELEPILQYKLWVPAHVLLVDRDKKRIEDCAPDLNIPGIKGMSDLDFCLQVTAARYKVAEDHRVVVLHPWKKQTEEWLENIQNPTVAEEQDVFPKQVAYMLKKWGKHYADLYNVWNSHWAALVRKELDKQGIPWPEHWEVK